MRFKLLVLALLAFAAPAAAHAATPADGPSFDCAAASRTIERTICAAPELAAADRTMAALYAAVRVSAFGKGPSNHLPEQREWLRRRDACAPLDRASYASLNACLASRYKDRNLALAHSALLAAPDLALTTLRQLDPKAAPILEALALYVADPAQKGRIAGALREPLDAFWAEDSFGRDILADLGIKTVDDMLASDANFGNGLLMLAVYSELEAAPLTIPCAAILRRPGLATVLGPMFGSTMDNFVPVTDCASALPPLRRVAALDKAIWAGWPECEGTIRYSAYRDYHNTLDEVRLGLATADGPAKYPGLRVKGLAPRLASEAVTELASYYQQWRDADAAAARRMAEVAVGELLGRAHECGT